MCGEHSAWFGCKPNRPAQLMVELQRNSAEVPRGVGKSLCACVRCKLVKNFDQVLNPPPPRPGPSRLLDSPRCSGKHVETGERST